ncbi:MAG: hypothetical protein QXJ97_01785 [Desulfurococcaceae archaeon]
MAGEVREPEVAHVTVIGRITPLNSEDYMKLCYLAYRFRKNLVRAVKMYARGVDKQVIVKEITRELNLGYADTIYKMAKLIVEGARRNGSSPLKIKVRKLFIASRGFSANKGNRNIRLESTNTLYVNIPREGWVRFKVSFGENYIPLVKELVEFAESRKTSYTAKIVFRNGRIYLHLSIPIELYLKHFRKGEARGDLIAGFDLNSDRVNMVIVDKSGVIRDAKTEWFPEVTSPGYPRNKAVVARLQALSKLIEYAYHHGVGVAVFEDLNRIKRRRFTCSPVANRKMSRFPKRKLLEHGVVMALKHGFKVYLVDPSYTSVVGGYLSRELGLDKHTASAYMLTAKYLGLDLKSLKVTQITRKTKN